MKLKYKFQIDTDYIGEMYVSSSDILMLATKQNTWYIMLKGYFDIFYISESDSEEIIRNMVWLLDVHRKVRLWYVERGAEI